MKKLEINTELYYSQDNYNSIENFKNLRGDTYWYLDWGNYKAPESLEDLFEISLENRKGKLSRLLVDSYLYNDLSWAKTKEDVISEIFSRYSLKDMKDFVSDLEYFGIEYTRKFDRYVSTGYSQGDCIEVFIPQDLITEVKSVSNLHKAIDQYCWDSEIYGTFTISFDYEIVRETFDDKVALTFDEEFEFQEWCEDSYEPKLMTNSLINYIKRQTHNSLSEEDYLNIEIQLNLIDSDDIKWR